MRTPVLPALGDATQGANVRYWHKADICTTRGSTASGAKFPMGNPQ